MSAPFSRDDAQALISDPTSSLCGNFVKTLLRLPVLFYQWVSAFVADDGEYVRTIEPGDLIYSFAPLVSNTHRLRCDGAAYSTTTYAILYAAIGNAFDTMDGASAPGAGFFRVPKCGARFPLATGSLPVAGAVGLGGVGGNEQHTLTEAEMPAHTHTISASTATLDINAISSRVLYGEQDTLTNVFTETADTGSTGGGDPHDIVPPYFGVHCYIATGI